MTLSKQALLARRAFSAALRAADPTAMAVLKRVMRQHRGCVRATAHALGFHEQGVWTIARSTPAVRELLRREGYGRSGNMAYRYGRPQPKKAKTANRRKKKKNK